MQMKLLMSLGIFYPSQVGGPSNTLYWIGKELVQNDIRTTTIVSDLGVSPDFAPRNKWISLSGIRIKYCVSRFVPNIFKLTWLTIKEVPANDVLMLSSLFYKANLFVGLFALLCRKAIIWSPRGELLIERGVIKRAYLKLMKFIFAKRIIFHATSEEELVSVKRFMGEKARCFIIPNYMELPQKIEPIENENYLLYVGRISRVKALEKLIEGVAKSKLFAEKNYKLYLAGKNEGEYYDKLLSLINKLKLNDKVIFKGMVEGDKKELLYAGAKATMLLSHSENFGNVIIESLAQGTPAITSQGTPWQILEKEEAGYWIKNTPEIIGKTIDKLLSMPHKEYTEMRNRSYGLCCRNFDIKTNIDKWIKILEDNV